MNGFSYEKPFILHNKFILNVLWLFLAVPWVGLQCVIVVFPDPIYLFFHGSALALNLYFISLPQIATLMSSEEMCYHFNVSYQDN